MAETAEVKNKVQYLPTGKLKLHPDNPRFIHDRDFEILCQSIENNPDYFEARPLLCTPDLVVFAGNMRLRAAKHMKLKQVPVVVMDITPERVRELMVRDNIQNGEWDIEALIAGFEMDELKAWGMPDFVFDGSPGESEDVEQAAQLEAKEDDYEIPETIKTDIVRGDLFEIGPHRLLCGDSTNSDDAERLMGGGCADITFTSPPYGFANSARIRDKYVKGANVRDSLYNSHKDDPDRWAELMDGFFSCAMIYSSAQVVNIQMLADNKRSLIEWLGKNAGSFVDVIVWDKTNGAPQMSENVLSNAFEFIFIFGGNGSRSIPFAKFHGNIQNIFRFNPAGKNEFADVHRAVFPVALPSWIIGSIFSQAKSIYDPFSGTGTTMVAAHQLGRKCYGMEIDERYCQVIVDRMLKLDPTLEIKRNGKPYNSSEIAATNAES